MTTATRRALRSLRARHGLAAVVVALTFVFGGAVAFAYWTTTGSGSSTATAASLGAPTAVTGAPSGSTVTVAWTGTTPPGATLTGYYVTRYVGATPSNACGTVPGITATYIATGTHTCNDTSVSNGTYTYRVTAVFRTWTAQSTASAAVVVNADPTPPTQVVSLTSGAGTAYLGGTTVYYRGDLGGSFTLATAVTDSGSGPASATFPGLSSNGWTHTLANPSSGSGSAPTITYQGGTYTFGVGATSPGIHTVTGRDVQGNTVTTNLSFATDVTAPTGGAFVVNGVTGTAGGATAYSTNGTITATRTDFTTDGGSGVATNELWREAGTLSNGVCSAFGAMTLVAGAPSETGLATGCYRYTLIGTDRVGNQAPLRVTVQVDTTSPTQVVTHTGTSSSKTGNTVYYRSDVAGSLTLSTALTDSASGPASVVYPALAASGWTHALETVSPGTGSAPTRTYPSSAFSWSAGATTVSPVITGTDLSGRTVTTTLTFVADQTGPTGGALVLNGTAAAAAPSTSVSGSGTFTGTRTDYSTDAGSGLHPTTPSVLTRAVAPLTGGTCGTYAAATVVAGVPNESNLATGCYRYVLTGMDAVGNLSTLSTVVRVDRDGPTQTITEQGSNSHLSGATLWYRGGIAGSLTLTSVPTDSGLGIQDVQFPAFSTSGWGHTSLQTVPAPGPYVSTAITWTAVAGAPSPYTVTARDTVLNGSGTTLTFQSDTGAPTGGALTVDGTAATGGGATTISNDGTFTGSYSTFTDAGSGMDPVTGNRIRREVGTLSNGACSAYGAPVDVTWTSETNLPTGCYRYTAIGTDNVGNTTSLSVAVQVDRQAPSAQAITENGTNTHLVGTTLYFNDGVDGSFTLDDTVTDAGIGPGTVTFPDIATAGWDHASETATPTGGTLPTRDFTSSPFSWTAGASVPATYGVAADDAAGNTATTNLTFVADSTGPTGGALTVNGVTGTAAGAFFNNDTNGWTGSWTHFNADAGSGFVSSELTRVISTSNTCTAWGAPTVMTGTTFTQGAPTPNRCYRYTLTGTDNVGNISVRTVTVTSFNDNTAPTQVFSATGNGYVNGTTLYYRSGSAGSMVLTSTVTDYASGPARVVFPALTAANWTAPLAQIIQTSGVGTVPTIAYSATYTWNAAAAVPGVTQRRFFARDNDGNQTNNAASELTFTQDNSAPTGGGLTVNNVAAAAAATASTNQAGSFAINVRADFTGDTGSGYDAGSNVLTREFGALNAGACTTGISYGAPTTISGTPLQSGLAVGCYRYRLTGSDRVGNTTSYTTVVRVLAGSLTQTLTLNQGTGRSYLDADTVHYNPATPGSFTLDAVLTGTGSNPAQVNFPAIATTNWTHNNQTDNTGTGTLPSLTYNSTAYSWTIANPVVPGPHTVTGQNALGNTVTTTLTFNADSTGPSGGSLVVDGVTATTGGVTNFSSDGDGTFPVVASGTFSDSGAGVASTSLTKEVAPLSAGVCGTFAAPTAFSGSSDTVAATGCYRYSYAGIDNVGNTGTPLSATVKVDLTAPTIALVANGPNAYVNGTTVYYRGVAAGSTTLTANVTDDSTPAEVDFPDIASAPAWTHAAETVSPGTGSLPTLAFTSTPYSWTAGASAPTSGAAARTITARDEFGNVGTLGPLTFVSDVTPPSTAAALTVNGANADAGGTTSNLNSNNPQIAVTARTDFTADAGSGMPAGGAGSVLSYATATWNGTACGSFGAETALGAGLPANLAATGATCYRYTLTGTDNVGNSTSISTTVRVNLQVRSVTLADGPASNSGVLNRTDTITVQYTGPIAVSSLCSTWTGDTSNQLINGNNVVGVTIQEPGPGNDYVTVSTSGAACGGDFNFGRVTLGADGYLTSTTIQTFRGTGGNASTIAYDASTYTLTITLGRNETTPGDDGSNEVAANTVAVYTPDVAITGVGGLAVTGTASTANVRQF